MPWKIVQGHSGCGKSKPYAVVSTVSGRVHGCHATKSGARQQQKALYARGVAAEQEEATMGWTEPQLQNGWVTTLASNASTAADAFVINFTTNTSTHSATEELADASALPTWEAVLAFEGMPTSDRRYLMPGKITHRDLPLSLMGQTITDEGHDGAEVVGNITEVWRVERPDLGDNVVAVMGRGGFADTEKGREVAKLIEDEMLRGVSIDFAPSEVMFIDADSYEPVDEDELEMEDVLNGKYLRGIAGEIMGATVVPFPAFGDAHMEVIYEELPLVAAAPRIWPVEGEPQLWLVPAQPVLTAAAAGVAPLDPPKAWFEMPEPDLPVPLTVTDDGRVYGHLALWDQCHSGFAACELANRSKSSYAFFHTGQLKTSEGENINVGRITVGEKGGAKGGHASIVLGTKGAIEHYDNTACVGAYVRATDGNLGIWVSGAVRSDCPAERIRDMKANPPSGDWRWEKSCRELVAILCVPVGGFAIPRYEARVASAADDGEEMVMALVATGYVEEQAGPNSRAAQRKVKVMTARARKELRA